MRTHSIYGLGGAIVDTEVSVSEQFIVDANIEKGVMTLVDERRQTELLETLSCHDLKLVKKSGGSVCNSIVAASNLGANVFFSGKVADDPDGKLFIGDLHRAGVSFHSAGQYPGITGKCLVMVTDDAERTMNTYLGVSQALSIKDIDKQALGRSQWLYVEGYLITNTVSRMVAIEAIKFARENAVKIAISLSDPFVVETFANELRDLLGSGVDLIFCNKDEALAFTGVTNLESASENLKKMTKTFAITDGANGAITFDGLRLVRSEGYFVQAVDTNGAGDMFAGAFLYATTLNKDYHWAARLANYCAAQIVAQFGPRLEADAFGAIKENLVFECF